eukprot:scaffold38032_cov72-Phaeocystis_antarctica.AAC.1
MGIWAARALLVGAQGSPEPEGSVQEGQTAALWRRGAVALWRCGAAERAGRGQAALNTRLDARAGLEQEAKALVLAIIGGHPQRRAALAHVCPREPRAALQRRRELVGTAVDGGVVEGRAQVLRRHRDERLGPGGGGGGGGCGGLVR